MKNIVINFEKRTITLANRFSARAGIVGSAEHSQLSEIINSYPNYAICVKPKQTCAITAKYGSLKYDDMIARIKSIENDEEREALMAEFNTLRAGERYFTVRAWFIQTVLSIDELNLEENAA